MKKIKAVLFDLDNTLYDYDSAHKKALEETYRVFKKYIKISYKEFLNFYNMARIEIHRELSGTAASHNRVLYFQRLVEKTHNTVEPEIILKLYDAYWNTLLKVMKIHKGVIPLLKNLKKRGIKIGIITDLTAHIQLRKIHNLKISKYIDILVTSEEAGREKPHPSMFLFALNKLKILPNEAIFVGDNPKTDMEGANAIGMYTILIKKGELAKMPKEDYRKPNFVIKEIPEVLKVIEKIEDSKN